MLPVVSVSRHNCDALSTEKCVRLGIGEAQQNMTKCFKKSDVLVTSLVSSWQGGR